MLLSIIIPFYRVEDYLAACLDRLIALSAEECEALLVDDCGMDGSAAIAARYEAAHPIFRVIRREKNGGLSAARNTGLAEARGEYVYFLDSDDLPEADALIALARRAKEERLDVAKARFAYFTSDPEQKTPGTPIEPTEAMEGGALFSSQIRSGVYEPMVWQCVYRRAFLEENGLTMAEGLLFEDELFQAPALLAAKRAAADESCILLYRQREGSIMGSFAKNALWCASYLEICRRLSALAAAQPEGAAKRALQKRVGQIALSIAKNIRAYRLEGSVREEAEAFLTAHRRELVGYAMRSGDAAVCAQGALLAVSARAFMALYGLKG